MSYFTSLGASLKRLPGTYWVLWWGIFLNRLGRFVLPFLALHLEKHGLPESRIGTVLAAFGLGTLAAAPLGGWAADRFGRRPALGLGLLSSAAVLAAFPYVDVGWLLCASFMMGLTEDIYRPSLLAITADVVPEKDRDFAYGLQYWAFNLAFAVSPLAAGALAKHDTLWLFIGDAAATLVFALIAAIALPETRPARAAVSPPAPSTRAAMAANATAPQKLLARAEGFLLAKDSPYRHPQMLLFLLLAVAVETVFLQFLSALPVVAHRDGIAVDTYGKIMALNGIIIVVFQPLATSMLRHLARLPVMLVGGVLIGLGTGAQAYAATAVQYGLCLTVWTLGEIAFFPVAAAYVASLAPAHRMGTYQGAYQTTWGAATLLSPIFGMGLLEAYGPSALWFCCAGLIAAAITVFMALSAALHPSNSATKATRPTPSNPAL